MKKLFILMVLAMIMVGFSVVGSDAGVKKIRPDQLKILASDDVFFQNPWMIKSGGSSPCNWTTVVKLPVGKRVTKVKYYHRGSAVGDPFTGVTLKRVKMGGFPQTLAHPSSNDDTFSIISVEETSIDYPVVTSGYTYYINVHSKDDISEIFGIKIYYQD